MKVDAGIRETMSMVQKEGVNIAFGTDAGVFLMEKMQRNSNTW